MPGLDNFGPDLRISELSGANTISLRGRNAPYPIPNPQSTYGVKARVMRNGSTGAGLRVLQVSGTDVSHQDLSWRCQWLEPAQLAILDTWFKAQPPVKLRISFDGGNSWKAIVFQENGFVPERWESNWQNQSCQLAFHVLGAI